VRLPFLVRALVVLLLSLVPLRIVARGYLPDDDALRHAAKAVSGRPWAEILVLRPEVTMDSHPGWHAALGLVHRATGADPHGLVVVSVIVGLLALLLPPAFLLRRPEAWVAALAAFGVLDPRILTRFASGRPFLLSAGLLAVLCVLAPRIGAGVTLRRTLPVLAPAFAVVAWMHPELAPVPAASRACLLAREGAAAVVLLAALASGRPRRPPGTGRFVAQSLLRTVLSPAAPRRRGPPSSSARGRSALLLLLGRPSSDVACAPHEPDASACGPYSPSPPSAGARLSASSASGRTGGRPPRLDALEIERALEDGLPADDRRRIVVALLAGAAVLLAWSAPLRPTPLADRPFLALAAPQQSPALPDAGGVLYTDDMRVFYQLFYARPDAPWRYIVGYEPALMPPEDLATFRSILAARTPENFEPWVRKMRPEDRLLIRSLEGAPGIPGLAWTPISRTLWSGRVTPGGR
jgi:hypothetical protein